MSTPLKKHLELRERQRVEDLHAVLSEPHGRRVMAALIRRLKGDARELWCQSAAENGRRTAVFDEGLRLERELAELDPALFKQLVLEQAEADERDALVRKNTNRSTSHGENDAD